MVHRVERGNFLYVPKLESRPRESVSFLRQPTPERDRERCGFISLRRIDANGTLITQNVTSPPAPSILLSCRLLLTAGVSLFFLFLSIIRPVLSLRWLWLESVHRCSMCRGDFLSFLHEERACMRADRMVDFMQMKKADKSCSPGKKAETLFPKTFLHITKGIKLAKQKWRRAKFIELTTRARVLQFRLKLFWATFFSS